MAPILQLPPRRLLLVAASAACAALLAGCGAGVAGSPRTQGRTASVADTVALGAPPAPPAPSSPSVTRTARRVARPPFGVGLRMMTIVDPKRRVRIPGRGILRRSLVTLVRYPAIGGPGHVDAIGARPDRAAGPFPLVVFGHGFAVTPAIYARLLQAWARAGYVVVAPVFPLENANAPGGPDEADLVNQPADMSLVISRILAASADPANALAGLVNPRAIAVTGQSDGGETALAVAYYPQYLDRRVGAAVILSGAKLGPGNFVFPPRSPPLLATQGTADVINPPSLTNAFFNLAPAPKYLLSMFGAPHLPPYTTEQPQLGIVERVTLAFLDLYLRHAPGAAARLPAAGDVPGASVLHSYP